VAVKLAVDGHAPLLSETAAAFNEAATWIARVCWDEGTTYTNTAHHRVYGETRRHFRLGAQLAVCARAKAMEALKATRKIGSNRCPTFGQQGNIHYDARTDRLLPRDRVSLRTLHGRVVCRMLPGSRQRAMLLEDGWAIGGADLVQRNGTWVSPRQPTTMQPETLLRGPPSTGRSCCRRCLLQRPSRAQAHTL
jgi:putative transposase